MTDTDRLFENGAALALCGILAAFICGTAKAQEAAYPTVDEAAIAAEHDAMRSSGYAEYGGVIYQAANGLYGYTPPQTSHDTYHISVRVLVPGRPAALYHTHPGATRYSEEFSPDDIEISKRLALPSYIGVFYDHSVRRYSPTTNKSEVI